jgi:uncharacterized protein (DUF1800 family)
MKRFGYAIGVSVLLATSLTCPGTAAGRRFDQRLSIDKQIAHVLNRLTFGPRPGDLEQVRRVGVDKWIDLQLHPDRMTENPVLETKLAALGTLQLPMWQILEKYPVAPAALTVRPPSAMAYSSLTQQQIGILTNCSGEERRTALASLDPDMRRLVLAGAPARVVEGLPDDLQQEAESARKADQEERQRELRRRSPPLNELLSPEQIRVANRGTAEEKLALLNSFDTEKRRQIMRALPPQAFTAQPALQREAMAARQPQQFVNFELIEHKLYRALYSNRQLQEVLVDFWMNHFNVFNGKGSDRVLLTSFERDAIRPHVFGRFKDMLLATARHPAMLFYLDNWQSQAPREDGPAPPGLRRPGLNENYGRELMELHTLGVDGGYTQDDVIAVARAFTGWTIYDPQKFAEFQFNPAWHDRKEKVLLGHTIPAMGAEQDGLEVIDILAHHPSTARFISRKLAQRFVADDPPQPLVDRMAATFTRTDGDLRAVLQTLFNSPEFVSEGAWQAKLKSPLEMVVSAARAMNADVTDTSALAQRLADLGQPLYGRLEPTGYPNTGDAWMNTAGLLERINFATALAAGQIPGVKVDMSRFNVKDPPAVAGGLLNRAPSPSMLAAIEKGMHDKETTPSILATLVIGSPDFQRR